MTNAELATYDIAIIGGGAAGLELDRADRMLGTPPNALVLASSEAHSAVYMVVCEEILINVTPRETRVAMVENGVLQEVFIERASRRGLVGNIYLGKQAY